MEKKLRILGTRGVPAEYGGFETFAEALSLYLAQRGWKVVVYCQQDRAAGSSRQPSCQLHSDTWRGVERVHIPVGMRGPLGTIEFDLKGTWHALRESPSLCLILGYNTAVFSLLHRLAGRYTVMNMDGLEWKRSKWSLPVKVWFYVNERLGCWLSHHLVADNPEIARRLHGFVPKEKVTMIPYGADAIDSADGSLLASLGVEPYRYALVVARPEPENSILDIVTAFSRVPRGVKLVVLGAYDVQRFPYHRKVRAAANQEVLFPGAIYRPEIIRALRFYAALYVHGHRVGGTNPSLVEALSAGTPVLAHDNAFNRWTLGEAGEYFQDEGDCARLFDQLLNNAPLLDEMRTAGRLRHTAMFRWELPLKAYEAMLERWLTGNGTRGA